MRWRSWRWHIGVVTETHRCHRNPSTLVRCHLTAAPPTRSRVTSRDVRRHYWHCDVTRYCTSPRLSQLNWKSSARRSTTINSKIYNCRYRDIWLFATTPRQLRNKKLFIVRVQFLADRTARSMHIRVANPNLGEEEAQGVGDVTVRKSVSELYRRSIMAPSSIVTFPLSLRVSDIFPLLCSIPPLVSPKFPHIPLWVGGGLWVTKSKGVRLIVPTPSFQDFQPMWSWSTNVTDRQTTCNRNTALCTKVHRAVKTQQLGAIQWRKRLRTH